jgi:hypothetical protein
MESASRNSGRRSGDSVAPRENSRRQVRRRQLVERGAEQLGFFACCADLEDELIRESQYARLLVGALDLSRVPRPLDRPLGHV